MPLSPGLKRLYLGDFNVMSQQWQADGSVVLTFFRHADAAAVRLHVSDLYGPNENIIGEVDIPIAPAAHITARQHEAGQ